MTNPRRESSSNRDTIVQQLTAQGIGVGVHYPIPLHLQPAYEGLGLRRGAFSVAEAASEQVISLPMFAELTLAQQERVTSAIKAVVG